MTAGKVESLPYFTGQTENSEPLAKTVNCSTYNPILRFPEARLTQGTQLATHGQPSLNFDVLLVVLSLVEERADISRMMRTCRVLYRPGSVAGR